MKTGKRRIGVFLAIIMVLTLIPVSSFGLTEDFDTMITPKKLDVTEGAINNDTKAYLEATYVSDVETRSKAYSYKWVSCNSAGVVIEEVDGSKDNLTHRFWIPETLTEGTYYYKCEVKGYDENGDEIGFEFTDVAAVTVRKGVPVVIFDPNGGTFAEIIDNDKAQEVTIGPDGKLDADVIPDDPSKEGLSFAGWSLDGSVEKIIDPAEYEFTHTTRLYAVYAKVHEAAFDSNGGKFDYGGTEYYVKYMFGELYKDQLPADPTREGYKFDGWYFKSDSGEEISLESNYFNEFGGYYLPKDQYDFYANWTAEGVEPEAGYDGAAGDGNDSSDGPDTGDDSNMLPWMIIGVIALITGAAAIFTRKEKFER